MSIPLFFETDSLTAEVQVLSCQQVDDIYQVILDKTLFHPQGGGQPSDTGLIGDQSVIKVIKNGENITHYLKNPVPLGAINIQIDAQTRYLNSRLHSAGHLIGTIGERFGLQPIKAHHWPNEAKVSFKPVGNHQTEINTHLIQQEIELLIADDLERRTHFNQQGMRMVGFGGLTAYTCGGTHVNHLKEIGRVTIQNIKMKKGIISISYDIQ